MVKKCWWVWCKFSQRKESNRIFSHCWSWVSWWTACVTQWLSISSKKTCNSLWPVVKLLEKNCRQIWDKKWWFLGSKTNYVIHYINLQSYLPLGIKLTKIHGMLKFKQSDLMKKYIDFNTEKRTNAANSFEKDFLNWWLIVSMAKQWKIYKKNQCQTSKQRKRSFKIHQQTNSYYS